jgi:poly [ADP-ribose] polymerase
MAVFKKNSFFVSPLVQDGDALRDKIINCGGKILKTTRGAPTHVILASQSDATKASFTANVVFVLPGWVNALVDGKSATKFIIADDDDDDESSDDEELTPAQKKKLAKAQATPAAATKRRRGAVVESEEEESESEEEVAKKPAAKKAKALTAAEKKAAAKKEADEAKAAAAKKVAPAKKGKKAVSESEEESEEEDTKPAAKKAKAPTAAEKKAAAKKEADEAKKKDAAAKKAPAKKGKKAVSESEEESEDDKKPAAKAPAAKAPAKKTAKKDDADDADDADVDATPTNGKAPLLAPAAPQVTVQRVSMSSKRSVPVDEYVVGKDGWLVLTEGSGDNFFCYDFMLNQTNIGQNNNKFYLVQVLVDTAGTKYGVIFRWGRVNERGQQQFSTFTNKEAAINHANGKVREKSTHSIAQIRANPSIETKPGKYTYLQRFGSADDEDEAEDKDDEAEDDNTPPPSKLHPRVRELIAMISDVQMINKALFDFGFDVNKQPLGKLNKQVLERGLEVLVELQGVVDAKAKGKNDSYAINQLSSKFYTLVPHDHGRSVPKPIATSAEITKKIELVESLMALESAKKVLEKSTGAQRAVEDPIDIKYNSIGAEINYLQPGTPVHDMICNYAKNTTGSTHSMWNNLEFIDIFEVNRPDETVRQAEYIKANPQHNFNRQLLWHGSRLQNFTGILSTGLRLPAQLNGVHITGYMFGSGSYSANSASKSLNYCSFNPTTNEGCILLLEVLLGGQECMYHSDYQADKSMRAEMNSILGLGRDRPEESGSMYLRLSDDGNHELMTLEELKKAGKYHIYESESVKDSGKNVHPQKHGGVAKEHSEIIKVPMGKLGPANDKASYLQYDEFIVFNVAQIRIKYICRFKKPSHVYRWF